MDKFENINAMDRSLRVIVGTSLSLSVLFVPYEPYWMAAAVLASAYPLLTALVAKDPIMMSIDKIKLRNVTFAKPKVALKH